MTCSKVTQIVCCKVWPHTAACWLHVNLLTTGPVSSAGKTRGGAKKEHSQPPIINRQAESGGKPESKDRKSHWLQELLGVIQSPQSSLGDHEYTLRLLRFLNAFMVLFFYMWLAPYISFRLQICGISSNWVGGKVSPFSFRTRMGRSRNT